METRWKVLIVTLVIAIPAFMASGGGPAAGIWSSMWPWAEEVAAEPAGAQIAMLMLYSAIAAIAFGLAISFLVFGRPIVRRMAGANRGLATGVYLATAWLLGNWWIHDNLHMVNGHNYTGLIVLEFAFHVTLIGAGAYLALNFKRILENVQSTTQSTPGAAPA